MKATLAIEYIGQSGDAKMRAACGMLNAVTDGMGDRVIGRGWSGRKPWVAEITGRDPHFGYARTFVDANWQWERANSTGSRGVELWFTLETGKLYQVKWNLSWQRHERYFCAVTEAGDIYNLSDAEAEEWLNVLSASVS